MKTLPYLNACLWHLNCEEGAIFWCFVQYSGKARPYVSQSLGSIKNLLDSSNPLEIELYWGESARVVIPVEFMVTSNNLDKVLSKRIL